MKRSRFSLLMAVPVAILTFSATALGAVEPIPSKNCTTCGDPQKAVNQAAPLANSTDSLISTILRGTSLAKTFSASDNQSKLGEKQDLGPQKDLEQQAGWSPGQQLPGAFQMSWIAPGSSFDPSFTTAYYSSAAGIMNVPTAPWNLVF